MFHFKLYEHKSLYGMTYEFPNVGDGLGMHDHHEVQKHNCMVMRGSVLIYGPDKKWCFKLVAGDIMDLLDEHHPHEIYALEPNTLIMGMFVNGKPEGEEIPEEDRSGTIYTKMPTITDHS